MITENMKKIFCLAGALLLLTACSLDENPRDQIPEERAYDSEEALYRNAVATLYAYIGGNVDGEGLQGTGRGVYDLQTFGSDEAMLPTRGGDWYDGGLWQSMYKHSWDAGNEIAKNAWVYLYKVITLCNRSLEKLEAHKGLEDSYRLLTYRGEVRALRAIYYWYLLDLFGNVPIVTTSEIPLNEIQQSNREELFNFIVQEFNQSLPLLADANSTREGDYYGRVTQPVAYFVLAKLMLNASVYLKGCSAYDLNRDSYYERCLYYCERLENMGYRLEEKYADNFLVYNQFSVENIFTIPMDDYLFSNFQENIRRSLHYRHAAAYGWTSENGSCATIRALDIYGYDTPEQDHRFDVNFYAGVVQDLDGIVVTDRIGNPLVYYPYEVDLDLSDSPYKEMAGARMRKYEVDKNATKDGKLIDNDIVLFRFADVLLMRAEAKMRLGLDGSGDLNEVRWRSGMPDLECTPENLLNERLLELCWEGWRRQDLIRFGQYKSLYSGMDAVDESDGHTRLYPIPADALKLNPNLKQNPGY